MQDLSGLNVEEMRDSYRWRMNKMERMSWKLHCETHHGAHTPLMQTAELQEKHWEDL